MAVAGMVAAASNSTISQVVDGEKFNIGKVAEEMIIGGITSAVAFKFDELLGRIKKPKPSYAKEYLNKFNDIEKSDADIAYIESIGKTPSSKRIRENSLLKQERKTIFWEFLKSEGGDSGEEIIKGVSYICVGLKSLKEFLCDIIPLDVLVENKNLKEYYTEYFDKLGAKVNQLIMCIEK